MNGLRIHRSNYRWQILPGYEIRYGGDNPIELVWDEKLQVQDQNGEWRDVPIFEAEPIPENPREARRLRALGR